MMCMPEQGCSCQNNALHHLTIIGMGHKDDLWTELNGMCHSASHYGSLFKQFTSAKANGLTREDAAVTGRG